MKRSDGSSKESPYIPFETKNVDKRIKTKQFQFRFLLQGSIRLVFMRRVLFFSIRTTIHTCIYFSANTTTSKRNKKLRTKTTTTSTHHNELAFLFLSQKHTKSAHHKWLTLIPSQHRTIAFTHTNTNKFLLISHFFW